MNFYSGLPYPYFSNFNFIDFAKIRFAILPLFNTSIVLRNTDYKDTVQHILERWKKESRLYPFIVNTTFQYLLIIQYYNSPAQNYSNPQTISLKSDSKVQIIYNQAPWMLLGFNCCSAPFIKNWFFTPSIYSTGCTMTGSSGCTSCQNCTQKRSYGVLSKQYNLKQL